MEDNVTKAGAILKHIVCDMPHAGRNLYLSERATIAESLFPDTLQTLWEDEFLQLGAFVEGAIVDFRNALRDGDLSNEGVGQYGIVEHLNTLWNAKLLQGTEREGFLYDANQKVEQYNNVFRTNYPPIGLKFGDYVFTADEHGNIDVRMKTNAVKPYLGIGFGQHFAKTHRLSLALDAGLLFWGTPKFLLNNDTEIKSSGKNSGISGALSWLKAWPNLQIRVAYKIF